MKCSLWMTSWDSIELAALKRLKRFGAILNNLVTIMILRGKYEAMSLTPMIQTSQSIKVVYLAAWLLRIGPTSISYSVLNLKILAVRSKYGASSAVLRQTLTSTTRSCLQRISRNSLARVTRCLSYSTISKLQNICCKERLAKTWSQS